MNDIKSIIQENNTVLVKMLDQCVADIKAASDLAILAIKNGKKIIGAIHHRLVFKDAFALEIFEEEEKNHRND